MNAIKAAYFRWLYVWHNATRQDSPAGFGYKARRNAHRHITNIEDRIGDNLATLWYAQWWDTKEYGRVHAGDHS